MIGDRETLPTDNPVVQLERAKAIWAFRTTELVTLLWDYLDQRADDPLLQPALDDLRDLLAGDDYPRPARTVAEPRVRPAAPSRICTTTGCPCSTGGPCTTPPHERELIARPRTEPGA